MGDVMGEIRQYRNMRSFYRERKRRLSVRGAVVVWWLMMLVVLWAICQQAVAVWEAWSA